MRSILALTLAINAELATVALAVVSAIQAVVIARYARQSRRARIQLKTRGPSNG